jgi:hypothetical protein
MNQLVTDVWEPSNCLEVVPDALIEVFLCEVHIIGALFTHNVGPLHKTHVLETLAHQVEQCWTIFLHGFRKSSKDLQLEVRKRECKEVLGSKSHLVRCNVSFDIL